MKLILALFLSLLPLSAQATITIQSVTGVSRYSGINSTTSGFNIYGGLAAGNSCSAGSSTCNSCSGLTSRATCNENKIGASTEITITFTSTTAGYPAISYSGNSTTTLTTTNTSSLIPAGSTATLTLQWAQLCTAINSANSSTIGTDCNAITGASESANPTSAPNPSSAVGVVGQGSFSVGINPTSSSSAPTDSVSLTATVVTDIQDTNYTVNTNCTDTTDNQSSVLCNYIAYPGDSKITLTSPETNGSWPGSPNTANFSAIRLYYTPTTFSSAFSDDPNGALNAANSATLTSDFAIGNLNLNSPHYDLPLDGSGNPTTNGRVTGLTNNTVYVFKSTLVDVAGNIGFWASDTSDLICSDGTQYCHIAQPGSVLGVLDNTLNCFIATAAYGSPFASKVQTFRDFRDHYLMSNSLGRAFVKSYYHYGPYAARFIATRPRLKALTRGFLFPVWAMAWLSVHVGGWATLFILFSSIGLIIFLARSFWRGPQWLRRRRVME
jgi:hypothetical protein